MTWQSQIIVWDNFLRENEYTHYEFNKRFKIQIGKYLNDGKIPREKTLIKIEDAMKKILTDEKIPHHPSYGYATAEQIKELNNLGLGPERDRLMSKIADQNQSRGKVYR